MRIIAKRHTQGGDHPSRQGDLFPDGTTRDQILQAAKKIVASGARQSNPSLPKLVFTKRMTINGKRTNYKVIVAPDDSNRIISMFPMEGGF